MLLVMTLEGQREVEHRLLQQLAFGAELVGRDRFEFSAERGVENLRVGRSGFAGAGGKRMLAGKQRNCGAGKNQPGPAKEQAARRDRVGHQKEGHGNLRWGGGLRIGEYPGPR